MTPRSNRTSLARNRWQESRVQWVASLPSLIHCSVVVEVADGSVRPGERGDDEAHPGEQLPEVMLDLGDHPARPIPGGRLILKASVPDQRSVAGSAAGSDKQIFDGPLQDVIGWEADRVPHPPPFQRFVEGGQRKGGVGADNDGLALRAVPVNDGKEHFVPPVRAVDVARPELGGQAVAVLVENKQRMVADGFEVAVVG